jgi:hypothetical protein
MDLATYRLEDVGVELGVWRELTSPGGDVGVEVGVGVRLGVGVNSTILNE